MVILEGKTLAKKILKEIKEEIQQTISRPGLAVIMVGEDPASKIYIKNKEETCQEVGINFYKYLFPADCPEEDISKTIEFLNRDQDIQGIIVQLPLPQNLDTNKIIGLISPAKDVDGFHPLNLAKLISNKPTIISPTSQAVTTLLFETRENLDNKKIIILANSEIFAKPLIYLLEQKGLKAQLILSNEKNWPTIIKEADALITVIGQSKIIKKEMVKDGSVIIDVGTTYLNGKPIGDVDFENVKDKVKFITPVPGGVGPLTVAYLLKNLLQLAK
jgi:methylenetetrahydrofolate dehydrogenase (NADP+)/methenyltetrahydrofolate cyclohydrolase